MRRALLGLALVAASAAVPRASDEGRDGAAQEPLARALAPLGPLSAALSAALWVGVHAGQRSGDAERVAALGHALLELHPDLDSVRRFLAGQLVVTEAQRAADRTRHDALVRAGLGLLEDGLDRGGGDALRVELAETLVVQRFMDPLFEAAATAHFGAPPLDVALELLDGATLTDDRRRLLAGLHVEHGRRVLARADDVYGARADLAAARRALAPLRERPGADAGELDALLDPLVLDLRVHDALEGREEDAR